MNVFEAVSARHDVRQYARVEDRDRAREILGFPADRTCRWMIAFGCTADRPPQVIRHPNRRPFDEVVHRGRW